MSQYPNAAEGLKKIFISQIVSIVGAVLAAIPVIAIIGSILAIVAFVLYMMGLKKAGEDADSFNKAITLIIINIVITLASALISFIPVVGGLIGSLLDIASSIVGLVVLNIVITTTCGLLNNVGSEGLAEKGQSIWKLYLVCTVVSVICGLLSVIPIIDGIAAVVSLVAAIAIIVAAIRYIIFLNSSAKALGA